LARVQGLDRAQFLLTIAMGLSVAHHRFQLPALVIVIALGLGHLRARVRSKRGGLGTLSFAALVLACSCVFSLCFSFDMDESMRQVVRVALLVGFVFCAATLFDPDAHVTRLVIVCCLVGIVFSASIPLLVEAQPDKFLGIVVEGYFAPFRLKAIDSANPNVIAAALTLVLPFAMTALLRLQLSMKIRLFVVAAVVIMVFGEIILQSRGALAGMLVGFGIALAFCVKRLRMLAIVAPILIACISVAFFWFEPTWVAWLKNSALDARAVNWLCGRYLFQDFMFTGVGLGNFNLACTRLYPELMREPSLPYAHNLWLEIGLETGVFGLLACSALVVHALRASVAAVFQAEDFHQRQVFALCVLCSLCAGLTHGLVDAVPWGTVKPAPLFWLIVGLGLALSNPPVADDSLTPTLSQSTR
jgi:O-antigen ligase